MKRFFIKSIACILLTASLAVSLPFNTRAQNTFGGAPAAYAAARAQNSSKSGSWTAADYAFCAVPIVCLASMISGTRPSQAVAYGASTLALKIGIGTTWVLLEIAKPIMGLAAMLFDLSIHYSILEVGTYKGLIDGISFIWSLFRDFINIFFIFLMLFVAIAKIIGSKKYIVEKMIPSIIIAAIFINFSLFITKVIIDSGNIIATVFYNQALSLKLQSGESIDKATASTIYGKNSLSAVLVDMTHGALNIDLKGSIGENAGTLISQSLEFILLCIFTWALLTVAFLFIERAVVIMILMILSPVAFLSGILPALDKMTDKWWEELINKAIQAPVFLIFLLFIIRIGQTEFVGDINSTQNAAIPLLKFSVIVALLIFTVHKVKEYGGEISGIVSDWGKAAIGLIVGAITGGFGFAARGLVGRGAAALMENGTLKAGTNSSNIAVRMASRGVLRGSEIASKSSFDVRNVGFIAKGAKDRFGVDMGKGAKDGFAQRRDAYAKEDVRFAKDVLNRDNLKEEEALREHNKVNESKINRLDSVRYDVDQARLEYNDARTNAIRKEELRAELATKEKELAELQALKKMTDLANSKDAYGNQSNSDEAIKARKDILEERKKAYQKKYADDVEGAIIGNIKGYAKKSAEKVRKDVVKGKTLDQKLAEAAKEAYAADQKAAPAAQAAPAAPAAAPAAAAPGAGGGAPQP